MVQIKSYYRQYCARSPARWLVVVLLAMLLLTGLQLLKNSNSKQQGTSLHRIRRVAYFTSGLGPIYFELVERQIAATNLHFCKAQPFSVHYFVFTDQFNEASAASNSSVTFIPKQSQGWPRDSDDRYAWCEKVRHL